MNEKWISASQTWALVWPEKRPMGGPNSIINRAASGVVKAKASLLIKLKLTGEVKEINCAIPETFWRGQGMVPNWDHGDFSARVQHKGQEEEWRAFGVTFERSGIEAMLPPTVSAIASTQLPVAEGNSRRGRRPDDDWEAVMIELARQLFVGDLKPKKLADVEKSIACYLLANGVNKSESTIREHARPFWTMYEREAGE